MAPSKAAQSLLLDVYLQSDTWCHFGRIYTYIFGETYPWIFSIINYHLGFLILVKLHSHSVTSKWWLGSSLKPNGNSEGTQSCFVPYGAQIS